MCGWIDRQTDMAIDWLKLTSQITKYMKQYTYSKLVPMETVQCVITELCQCVSNCVYGLMRHCSALVTHLCPLPVVEVLVHLTVKPKDVSPADSVVLVSTCTLVVTYS